MKHEASSQAATIFRFCRLAASFPARCPIITSDIFLLPRQRKQRFLKKARKNFYYAGLRALAAPAPMTQINKVFLLLFVHKK
jgi:hypothetical protein